MAKPKNFHAQWQSFKDQHPDSLIFSQCGYFWETFEDDAHECGRLFGWKCSTDYDKDNTPFTGVPFTAKKFQEELKSKGISFVLVLEGSGMDGRLKERFVDYVFDGKNGTYTSDHSSQEIIRTKNQSDELSDEEILVALSHGADPRTGELIENGCLSESRTQKAIRTGLSALRNVDKDLREATLEKPNGTRKGLPWTGDEEQKLLALFEGGDTLVQIREKHNRSSGAIRSRLKKLGKDFSARNLENSND